ncbi:MAG: hypothetical protein IKJ15_00405 [Lachnospiraceae bacterium]|nr:hypothetical protein [Lachnospiraceae bacterium]
MQKIDNNMSAYLHQYEAYRIPKGTTVKDMTGNDVVLSNTEDVLVLTEEASRQLVKDRGDYGNMLQTKAELAAQKTQSAAMEQMMKDQAKALAVFRSMADGDIVPDADERKLMEYDDKLYQAAKMAQAMAQRMKKEAENKESEWDEREEKENQRKREKLCEESNEAALAVGTGVQQLSAAQKQNIVEIDSNGVDLSNITAVNLGSGVTGSNIDLSL